MNKKIWICIACLLLAATAFSQQTDKYSSEYRKQAENQLTQVLNKSSPEVRQFHEKLVKAETANEVELMIFSLGKIGNKDFVPYLKTLIKNEHCERCIEVVLVQLGEKFYFDKTVSELKSAYDPIFISPKRTNDERLKCAETYVLQNNAIWKLARFKTKEAYQKLYELLGDKTDRDVFKESDASTPTKSSYTISQLCQAIENYPLNKNGRACATDVSTWKVWFELGGLIEN